MDSVSPALFLFDIDGTLLRGTALVHREAFGYAFREVYGVPLDLDGVAGAGRTDSWLVAEPLRRYGFSHQEIQRRMPEAFAAMDAYVAQHLGDLRETVLPGVPEVLDLLQADNQLLGLVTGNLAGIAESKLQKAGLAHYFEIGGFGGESEIRYHLVPVALAKAEELIGRPIAPERVAIIGDTPLDVEAGQVNGTRTAGVATGPFTPEELQQAGADLILPSLAEPMAAVAALLRLVGATE